MSEIILLHVKTGRIIATFRNTLTAPTLVVEIVDGSTNVLRMRRVPGYNGITCALTLEHYIPLPYQQDYTVLPMVEVACLYPEVDPHLDYSQTNSLTETRW